MIGLAVVVLAALPVELSQEPWIKPRVDLSPVGFGSALTAIHDADGDGAPDLLVGAPFDRVRGVRCGSVSVVSLGKGSVLYRIAGASPGQGFGSTLAILGDLDGDGVKELAIGSVPHWRSNARASVTILSGATFGVLRHVPSPSITASMRPGDDMYGASCATIADCDRDGVADYVVGIPRYSVDREPRECTSVRSQCGAATLFSGRSGGVIRQFLGPSPAPRGETGIIDSAFGTAVADLSADLDGDGLSEVVVTAPGSIEEVMVPSQVSIHSPGSGSVLANSSRTTDNVECGNSLAMLSDIDGDGIRDIAVGSPPHRANVFSGRNLKLLYTVLELQPGGYEEGFGDSICAVEDQDGDALLDLVVGCREEGDFGDDYYLALFSGKTGKLLGWQRTDRQQMTVCAVPDQNQDERADIAVGLLNADEVRLYSFSPGEGGHEGELTCLKTIRPSQGAHPSEAVK